VICAQVTPEKRRAIGAGGFGERFAVTLTKRLICTVNCRERAQSAQKI
jgi:hypothetical protein